MARIRSVAAAAEAGDTTARIRIKVNNLTDEPFKTFENGDERRTIDYQSYGRTFAVGVNYRF